MFSMIDWRNDHLTLRFAKSKKDQLGDRCHTIRLFANPWNYKMCAVTALAIRLTEKGIRRKHNRVFACDAASKYANDLRKYLKDHERSYMESALLGTHSVRKGAANHATGQGMIADVLMATLLRGHWNIGNTLPRYFRIHEGSDAVVGRMLAGLNAQDTTFAALPPHFKCWNDELQGILDLQYPSSTNPIHGKRLLTRMLLARIHSRPASPNRAIDECQLLLASTNFFRHTKTS